MADAADNANVPFGGGIKTPPQSPVILPGNKRVPPSIKDAYLSNKRMRYYVDPPSFTLDSEETSDVVELNDVIRKIKFDV